MTLGLLALGAPIGCRTDMGRQGARRREAAFSPSPDEPRVVAIAAIRSWRDVRPPRGLFEQALRGTDVAVGGTIRKPAGLTVHDRTIYVCDTRLNAVLAIQPETGRFEPLNTGPALAKPIDVCVAPDGHLLIADPERRVVIECEPSGKVVRELGPDSSAEPFRPVAVACRGDTVVVANVANHTVEVYDRESGRRTQVIGGRGSEPGRFHFPTGVALGPDLTYVVDMLNYRVQVLDDHGRCVRTIGGPGNHAGSFVRPKRVAAGEDGLVFVTDAASQRLQVFDANGRSLLAVGGNGDHRGALVLPAGVCIDRSLLGHFAPEIPEGFTATDLIFVADQVGDPKVNVYALGHRDNGSSLGT